MEHDKTGFQTPPEGPILCINNCGFFGSAANMYMCSKCYKDMILKQKQAKLAASSINNIVNGSPSGSEKEAALAAKANVQSNSVEGNTVVVQSSNASSPSEVDGQKGKTGPNRCSTCKKRVGLAGFTCRCGNHFCGSHRYSDKHDCPFDYHAAAQGVIAEANPVVKADKLDKI